MKKQKKSTIVSFTVPAELHLLLEAAQQIGYYDSLSEFLRDAIRTMLQTKKDLRIALAHVLWKEKKIGMGKAAEIIQCTVEEATLLLNERELIIA